MLLFLLQFVVSSKENHFLNLQKISFQSFLQQWMIVMNGESFIFLILSLHIFQKILNKQKT